ncbi:MAG: glycosyltransferase family 39 protein [bacterium]
MMKKISFLLLIIILLSATVLRGYNLAGRATFEWDQERDQKAISTMIQEHKPSLVGPVTQGQGGFLLGPLYYYLLIPAHLVMSSNPLSQSTTSILIDLGVIIALYVLGNRLFRPSTGLIAASIWAFSAYTIRLSLVSWNVSLVPLYTLGSLALGLILQRHFRFRYILISLFWLGLAWHIHPSVVFQIPIVLWLSRSSLRRLSLRNWLFSGIALVLPLTPWIVFDLRHQFTNTKLLLGFVSHSSLSDPIGLTLTSLWEKYSFELSQLIFGRQLLVAGSVLVIIQLFLLWHSRSFVTRFLAFNLFFNALALILMRNVDFGNYYLLNLLLLNVWLLVDLIVSFRPRYSFLFLLIFLVFNFGQYRFTTQPFSLKVKAEVLNRIAVWNNPVDLEISLPVGRRSGFDWYLANTTLLRDDDMAPNVAYIVESEQMEINAPVKARSIVIQETIGGFRFVGYKGN